MSIVAREYFNNQPISLLEHNNDIYFHALSIAKALDYQHPKTAVRNFIARRLEDIKDSAVSVEPLGQSNLSVSAIATVAIDYKNSTSVFLNFEALSLFVDYSQAPNAPALKKQMAKCTHQNFKKEQQQLQVYQTDSSLTMLESLNKQFGYAIEILRKQEDRIQELEASNRIHDIDRHQAYEISKKVQKIVSIVAKLEGEDKPTQKHFKKIYGNFKDHFRITSYKELPKAQFTEAMALLESSEEKLNRELAIS